MARDMLIKIEALGELKRVPGRKYFIGADPCKGGLAFCVGYRENGVFTVEEIGTVVTEDSFEESVRKLSEYYNSVVTIETDS